MLTLGEAGAAARPIEDKIAVVLFAELAGLALRSLVERVNTVPEDRAQPILLDRDRFARRALGEQRGEILLVQAARPLSPRGEVQSVSVTEFAPAMEGDH